MEYVQQKGVFREWSRDAYRWSPSTTGRAARTSFFENIQWCVDVVSCVLPRTEVWINHLSIGRKPQVPLEDLISFLECIVNILVMPVYHSHAYGVVLASLLKTHTQAVFFLTLWMVQGQRHIGFWTSWTPCWPRCHDRWMLRLSPTSGDCPQD